MNNLLPISLCLLLVACDKITEDAPLPEVSHPSVVYTRDNGKAIMGFFGDFDRDDIVISSNSSRAAQIANLPYVEYTPDSDSPMTTETIQVELQNQNRVVGRADISVVSVTDSDCVNSAFSDYHVITQDSTLVVDLMQNDAFCDFTYTSNGGVNMIEINNAEEVLISISSLMSTLTYTPPEGFSGTVEFIYELCYGFDSSLPSQYHWKNPVERCQYYYTALATIVVLDEI